MFTLFFMSHFCCPDSPKLRLHKYPLLPVLFQVLYCSVSFPGHPPVLLAGDGDIFRAGWAAPWCSFCPPAWIFCCRPYFTRINLYRALIAENNGAWEWKKKGYDCPWKYRTYWKDNVRTTYRVTQEAACQPRRVDKRRTRCDVQWMSCCAKHHTALKATTAPRKAHSRASNRHRTLPFKDFHRVSALSF